MSAYPSQAEVARMVDEAGGAERAGISRVAVRLGLTWYEINEILRDGSVSDRTAKFWQTCRRVRDGG